jgi:hypothetical protein
MLTEDRNEEKKAKRSEYMKEYFASPKGKASQAKYRSSPKGKAKIAEYFASSDGKASQAKYKASPKGRTTKAEYNTKYKVSPKGSAKRAEAQAKYKASPKGKAKKAELEAKYRSTPKGKAKIAEWENHKRKTDINFKIASNLRTRLYKAVKNNYKSGSAVKDLGCSIAELRARSKPLFEGGMTWENYGVYWVYDHEVPLAAFDLTKRDHVRAACHHTNLQPMEKIANIIKNDKYDGNIEEYVVNFVKEYPEKE